MNHHDRQMVFANPKLERILLGGLILSNHAFWEVEQTIRPDSFTVPLHRAIFENIADVIRGGQTTTLPLLCGRLPDEDTDEYGNAVSVRSYVSVCIEEAGGVGPGDVYGEIAELAAKRRLSKLAQDITAELGKDRRSDEIAAEVELVATDVARDSSPVRPKRLIDIARAVVKKSRMARDTQTPSGLTTGLASLDELVGTIGPTDLVCVLASTSDGKTSICQQIGAHVSHTKPVLLIQMEVDEESIAVREVAAVSGVSGYAIKQGAVDAWDFDSKVEPSLDEIARYDFDVLDTKKLTIRQIKAHAVAMKRSRGLGLLIIDQLDKIKPAGRTQNKFEAADEVITDLKDMCKELRVPILLMAQRSRMGQRENEVPDVNDAGLGSALEQNCDVLLGLWRREAWLEKKKPSEDNQVRYAEWEEKMRVARTHAEVIVLKNRNKKRFVRKELKWRGDITRFEDI